MYTYRSGFTLLFGVLLTAFLLAVGMSLLSFSSKQVSISGLGRESQTAFYAADSLVECIRYHDENNNFVDVYNVTTAQQLDCNGMSVGYTVTNAQCANADESLCPDNYSNTDDYIKITFTEENISAGMNQSAQAFLVKQLNNANQAVGSTLTVQGRNTKDDSSRRVERAVKLTYTPGDFNCPTNNTYETLSDSSNSFEVKAYAVRCYNQSDLPDWVNAPYNESSGANLRPDPTPITEQKIIDFVDSTGGACWFETNRCFEWGVFAALPVDKQAFIGTPNWLGAAIDAEGVNNFGTYYMFNSAATGVNKPAKIKIDTNDFPSLTNVWVRAVLTEDDSVDNDVNVRKPFNELYSAYANTEDPQNSAEIVCHNDSVNYDNYDTVLSPINGVTNPYICALFTANDYNN